MPPPNPSYPWGINAGDAMFTWIKLRMLELKLTGEFGQNTKYRRLVLERNATTSAEKLQVAEEVIAGGETSMGERQWHTVYLKNHKDRHASESPTGEQP